MGNSRGVSMRATKALVHGEACSVEDLWLGLIASAQGLSRLYGLSWKKRDLGFSGGGCLDGST